MSWAKSSPCTIFQLLRLRAGALRESHSPCDWNSTKKVLLWHFAVLEICWDLMWLCLNISAACPGPENAGYFCWCVNRLAEEAKRLWPLASAITNKRCTDRRNLGNNSRLAALVVNRPQRKKLRKVYEGISRKTKRHCGLPKWCDPLLLAEYCT